MALNEKLQEIVAKFPSALQPYVPHYVELLKKFTFDEIQAIVNQTVNGNSLAAYNAVISKMSNDELLIELKRINALMDGLIVDAKAETEYLKNFINVAIAIGLSAL